MRGVTFTQVGYAGGATSNPTYREVCGGGTGHAEVVEVEFDPEVLTFTTLLQAFWQMHDPTRPFKGQYRSVIFFTTEAQRLEIEASVAKLNALKTGQRTIATEIREAPIFTRAEEYHQQYEEKKGYARCRLP